MRKFYLIAMHSNNIEVRKNSYSAPFSCLDRMSKKSRALVTSLSFEKMFLFTKGTPKATCKPVLLNVFDFLSPYIVVFGMCFVTVIMNHKVKRFGEEQH